jgi:hypothetical protein
LKLAQDLAALAGDTTDDLSPEVRRLAGVATSLLRFVAASDAAPAPPDAAVARAPRGKPAKRG